MKDISIIGIDIGKSTFHFVGMNRSGKVVLKRRLYRGEVIRGIMNLPRCQIVMETCGGAHFWAREFRKLGFEVKLIAPQYVKPYVKGNKNDFADAEAIAEASTRSTMRYCSVKTLEQQELQHLHRVRERFIKQQTALKNELRGILLEYGICMAKGMRALRKFPEIIESSKERLGELSRRLCVQLYEEIIRIEAQVQCYDKELERISKEHPVCRRLLSIPGVGPITATAVVAAAGGGGGFKNGRHFSTWLGLVPKHQATGGKTRLLGISKRGDKYIRKLLVHGARSVLRVADSKPDALHRFAARVHKERGWNKAAVALANKNARIIWALLSSQEEYKAAA